MLLRFSEAAKKTQKKTKKHTHKKKKYKMHECINAIVVLCRVTHVNDATSFKKLKITHARSIFLLA